jgi:AcrR family transcriptional regulator
LTTNLHGVNKKKVDKLKRLYYIIVRPTVSQEVAMARLRITKEYDERLKELLDTAQELFFQKGYMQVSVRDIIEKVGVAKGTFYHYFKSKEDLLDQLVNRFSEHALARARVVVEDKGLRAQEKLNRFIATFRDAKIEKVELIKMLMKVMYTDDNLILRYKMFKRNAKMSRRLFSDIIRQGVVEGIFDPVDPEEAPGVIFAMGYYMNEEVVGLLLGINEKPSNIELIERKINVYERSVERILGASPGTFAVGDRRYIDIFRIDKGDVPND